MPTNEEFIRPFVEAALNVFTTMLNLQPVWTRTYEKTDNTVFGDISGLMGTAEGGAEGLIVVSMTKSVALKIGGGFLGTEPAEVDQDVKECVAELVNMIGGGAKAKLEGTPYFFKLAIPTVILGRNMEIHHKSSHLCVVAELTLDGQVFVVEVSMKK